MLEPKVPAIGASIGFVLSFLTGLINRASFSVLLLRAVLMALLFGGLTLLAHFAIKRFLPELLDESVAETVPEENSGNVVNITIGEDSKEGFSYDESGRADMGGMLPDFLEAAAGESSESGVFLSGTAEASGKSASRKDKPVEAHASSGSAPVEHERKFAGDLDVLPDLQDFAPQAKAEPEDDSIDVQSDSVIRPRDSVFVSSDTGNVSVESETMAKAIRTILSRDS